MAYIVVDVAFVPLIRQESEVLGEANVALTMTLSLLSEHIISPSLHRHERTAPDAVFHLGLHGRRRDPLQATPRPNLSRFAAAGDNPSVV